MEMKIEPLALPGVDTQRPIVIAGPCSAETEEQVLETAQGCLLPYSCYRQKQSGNPACLC